MCSIDLDAMDPAFVPGVNHYEPGGLTPRFVLDLVEGLSQRIGMTVVEMYIKFPTLGSSFHSLALAHSEVGADVVELCPIKDVGEMTAMVGAKITVRRIFQYIWSMLHHCVMVATLTLFMSQREIIARVALQRGIKGISPWRQIYMGEGGC